LEKAEIPGKAFDLAFVRRATVSRYTMAADCVVLLRHAAVSGYVMAANCASMRESTTFLVAFPFTNASLCFRSPLDFTVGQPWMDDVTGLDSHR